MSLETKIEELTGTVAALTTIIQQQLAVQERLLAGQAKAIETVAAGNPAAPAKRGRKAKDDTVEADTPNTSPEPADTASGADDASSAAEGNSAGADDASSAAEGNSAGADATTDTTAAGTSETTTDGTTSSTAPAEKVDTKPKLTFAVAAKKWLDQKEQGSAEYKVRGKTIMGILGNFGAAKMSEVPPENEDKAMFYLKRAASGLTINFDAEYDFEGDPKQDEPVADAATADEDEDIFG